MSTFENLELGQHYLVEFMGCDQRTINSADVLQARVLEAIARSGATIIKDVFHTFAPQGVTGVVVIAESHVAIHTWPEHGYAACDIFTCTTKMEVGQLILELKSIFQAADHHVLTAVRGPKYKATALPLS